MPGPDHSERWSLEMADFANSTPVPERPLLRGVDAPGLLLSSPELPARLGEGIDGTQDLLAQVEPKPSTVPRIPNRLCLEGELALLMDIKRRTEERLDELLALIEPGVRHLPMSSLRGMDPSVLLFKEWRHV